MLKTCGNHLPRFRILLIEWRFLLRTVHSTSLILCSHTVVKELVLSICKNSKKQTERFFFNCQKYIFSFVYSPKKSIIESFLLMKNYFLYMQILCFFLACFTFFMSLLENEHQHVLIFTNWTLLYYNLNSTFYTIHVKKYRNYKLYKYGSIIFK